MARFTDSTREAESEKSVNSLVTLVEVYVDASDPAYITDYARPLTVDGKGFLPGDDVMNITSVIEDTNNSITSIQLNLSGLESSDVNLFLDLDYIDKQVIVKKQFVNIDTDALVGASFVIFDGRIDSPVITHDPKSGEASVSVTVTSYWTDFGRKKGRHTNDSEQKSHFSTDTCFEHAIDFNKEIKWGQS